MVLETDENVFQAVNNYTATFVHEFIHYIQDLILPYSIRCNLSRLRWFHDIQQYAVKHGYIIRLFREWNDDSKTLLLQFNLSFGNNPQELAFIDRVDKINNVSYMLRNL